MYLNNHVNFCKLSFNTCYSDFRNDSEVIMATESPITNTTTSSPNFILQMSFEKELIKHIQNVYSAVGVIGRPVRNTSAPVVVYFGMGLVTMDIIERENMLTIAVWNKFVGFFFRKLHLIKFNHCISLSSCVLLH